jgi:DNA-binding CsgD family transcriptional regulator
MGDTVKNCCRCGQDYEERGAGRRYRNYYLCPACSAVFVKTESGLSFREQQIAQLISEGKANKEIAIQLHLTEGTVGQAVFRLFRKLGLPNRTVAAVWWTREHDHLGLQSSRNSGVSSLSRHPLRAQKERF